jgi:hypothetical protein
MMIVSFFITMPSAVRLNVVRLNAFVLCVVKLSDVRLNVVRQTVIRLSVVRLNVVILSVVTPKLSLGHFCLNKLECLSLSKPNLVCKKALSLL